MVKIILTLTTFLLSLFSAAQTTGRIVEGNFNGRNCISNRGLCDIDSTLTANRSNMKIFNTYKQSANTMVIELETSKLSTDDQVKFFGKEYSKMTPNETLTFVQDDDFTFDVDTLIYLGFDVNYKFLKKGTYPLVIVKDKILVTLTLSKQ